MPPAHTSRKSVSHTCGIESKTERLACTCSTQHMKSKGGRDALSVRARVFWGLAGHTGFGVWRGIHSFGVWRGIHRFDRAIVLFFLYGDTKRARVTHVPHKLHIRDTVGCVGQTKTVRAASAIVIMFVGAQRRRRQRRRRWQRRGDGGGDDCGSGSNSGWRW